MSLIVCASEDVLLVGKYIKCLNVHAIYVAVKTLEEFFCDIFDPTLAITRSYIWPRLSECQLSAVHYYSYCFVDYLSMEDAVEKQKLWFV